MKLFKFALALILLNIYGVCFADSISGPAGTYISSIQNEGSPVTRRNALNFIGAGIDCVDNSGSKRTDCTVTSGVGGGASSLAVGTGSASNFNTNVTSPTAVISFEGLQFKSAALGSTNYISLNLSSVTVEGKLLAGSNVTLTPGAGTLTIAATGGNPAGSNGSIQFNDNGYFGGNSGIQYDSSVSSVSILGRLAAQSITASTGVFTSSLTVGTLHINNGGSQNDKIFQAGNQGKPTDSFGDLFEIIISSINPMANTTRIRGRNNLLFYTNNSNIYTSTADLKIDSALVTASRLAVTSTATINGITMMASSATIGIATPYAAVLGGFSSNTQNNKLIQFGNQGGAVDAYGDIFEVIAASIPASSSTKIHARNNLSFFTNNNDINFSTADLKLDSGLVTAYRLNTISTATIPIVIVSTIIVNSSITIKSPLKVNGAATFDSTMYVANSFQGASFVTGEELLANGYSNNGAMIDIFDSQSTSSLAPTYSGILFKYTPSDTGFNTISQAYFSLRSSTPTVQKAHMVIGAGAIGGAGTTDYFTVDVSTVGNTIGNVGFTKALTYQGIRTVSSFPFVAASTDSVVITSCTAAVGCTVTLPAASAQVGHELQFNNIALSTQPVYYRTASGDLINGTTNQIVTYAGMSMRLISDGVNRWISTSDLPGPLSHIGDKGDLNAASTLLANYAYLFSVQIPKPSVITHMAYNVSATSATGTIDLGIYDSAGNRLGSTGAVVQTASSGSKQIALTSPAYCLVPGTYYLAVSANNATASIFRNGSNNIMGSKIFATSHPLPTSLNLISGGSGGSSIQYAIIGMTAGGAPF